MVRKQVSELAQSLNSTTLKDMVHYLRKAPEPATVVEELLSAVPKLVDSLKETFLLRYNKKDDGQGLPLAAELYAVILECNPAMREKTVQLLLQDQQGFDFTSSLVYPLLGSKIDWHISAVLRLLTVLVQSSASACNLIFRSINWSWEPVTFLSGKRKPTGEGLSVREALVTFVTAVIENAPPGDLIDVLRCRALMSQTTKSLDKDAASIKNPFIAACNKRVAQNSELSRIVKSQFFDSWTLQAFARVVLQGSAEAAEMLEIVTSRDNQLCIFPARGEKTTVTLIEFIKTLKGINPVCGRLICAALRGRPELGKSFFAEFTPQLPQAALSLKTIASLAHLCRVLAVAGEGCRWISPGRAELSRLVSAETGLIKLYGLRLLRLTLPLKPDVGSIPDLSFLVSLLPSIAKLASKERYVVLCEWGTCITAYRKSLPEIFKRCKIDWASKLTPQPEDEASALALLSITPAVLAGSMLSSSLCDWTAAVLPLLGNDMLSHAAREALYAVLEGCGVFRHGEPHQWLKSNINPKFVDALKAACDAPLSFLSSEGPCAVFAASAKSFGMDSDRVERRLVRKMNKEPVEDVTIAEVEEESEAEPERKRSRADSPNPGTADLRDLLVNHSNELIIALASHEPSIRERGLNALAVILERLEDAAETEDRRFMFREVPQAAMLMKMLRNSVKAPTEGETLPEPLPLLKCMFASHALSVIFRPEHPAYKGVVAYLTSRSDIESKDVPLWNEFFMSDDPLEARTLRQWVLRVAAHSASDKASLQVLERRGILEAAMTLSVASSTDRGAVALCLTLITNAINASKDDPVSLNKLLRRYGIIGWLNAITSSKHCKDDDEM